MQKIILIGDPVAHSRSHLMHNAALTHLGLAMRYEAVHTPAAELAARIAALRGAEYLGANITLPHKQAVIPFLDGIDELAAQIGAVNTIYKSSAGELIGTNTDAPGLMADLAEAGFAPEGRIAVILGASGAARAAAFGLAEARVETLVVANRTPERAEELLADLLLTITDDEGLTATGEPPPSLIALGLDDSELTEYLSTCDLLLNATSQGWHGDETPLPDPPVGTHTLVYDMVYRQTCLLQEAATRGAQIRDGLGMLVHQGTIGFTLWTGREAPLEVMWAALR
ncbi:shikimate dehydrogenase [Candidatus Chloroploca asiatica]|uniref:Shikimate dehydrogenase (NADP(+)) n=1 Tax=Candidatus Chloroploca asiatica TaxID=1506545 RepID=A0A2H3KNU2_9CHLR|nr:shikimate dehydrogenase [Candidatus Chloroploca asiatica]PDV99856.1 shikimate dehydrogenase [Candidatus Chloroploca asiatica]